MKKYPKLRQPENYILSFEDFEQIGNFDFLLDHLTDIPASEPINRIQINEVGLYNQNMTIYVEDFETRDNYIPAYCTINVGVDITENRGIHMSRCVQSIFKLAKKKYKTLDIFTAELANMVKDKQESKTGIAEVKGIYLHKRYTRKTGLESHDKVRLISKATAMDNQISIKTGMQVYNMTACPCTKAFTKYSIVPGLKSMELTLEQIKQILDITATGTHTQIGTTTILLDKENVDITHKDLYDIFDESTHLIYELLKRPDEHDFVQHAIKKPQFAEDVTREVAFNTFQQFKEKLSSNAEINVESILHDSIHIHDVRSIIKKTFGDIQKELES